MKSSRFSVFVMLLMFAGMFTLALSGLLPQTGAAAPQAGERLDGNLARLTIYAGPKVENPPVNLPSPQVLARAPKTATITVNYVGTWDAQAQAAFQYAVDIWETQITSSVPIVVNASWEPLPTGVLGGAGAWSLRANFDGAPYSDTWYPVALANKLAGADLEPGEPDIDSAFNSSFSAWHFGTGTTPPSGEYDFASVVLHEIGHGLGFFGSMQVSGDYGRWGYGTSYPAIYDRFTLNGSGQALLSFPNTSTQLKAQLTSGNIYFSGPQTDPANGGTSAKLFAPSSWMQGSSYSHLDEIFNGTANALMTYSLNPQEVQHNPGPVMLAMFGDMGWTAVGGATATPSPTPTITLTSRPTKTPGPSPTPDSFVYLPSIQKNARPSTATPTRTPTQPAGPTVTPSPTATTIPAADWLGYFNQIRALGNLPNVAENSDWSAACVLHSRYMVKEDDLTHYEDPNSPWYTPEGALAGENSNVMVTDIVNASDEFAIDLWMTGPFHGIGMLDPGLTFTGFGSYREADGGWQMGACLNVWDGWTGVPGGFTFPAYFPANGKTMPYLSYDGREYPDPLTSCAGYTAPSGPPIYLQLGSGEVVPNVTASSFMQNGTPLDHCVFDESTYTNPDTSAQALARSILDYRDAVILIPKSPLTPGATYQVSITSDGQTYTWSFTAANARAPQVNAEMGAAVAPMR
ncbi:MAG: hypothetical protein OHK0052_15630 [Anaerolineales bacterium]